MPDEPNPTAMVPWDTNVAAGLIVLGALLFLFLVRRGFRGMIVEIPT